MLRPVKSPCSTCAFRAGCVTATEPYNVLRSEICALGAVPFACHHGLDWTRHISVIRGVAVDLSGKSQKAQMCAGWKERVRQLAAEGRFRDPDIRQVLRLTAQRALRVIDRAIAAEENPHKAEYWLELGLLVELLRKGEARP